MLEVWVDMHVRVIWVLCSMYVLMMFVLGFKLVFKPLEHMGESMHDWERVCEDLGIFEFGFWLGRIGPVVQRGPGSAAERSFGRRTCMGGSLSVAERAPEG